jgi:CheY-like chemotaxis protein
MARVLVVDDEEGVRSFLAETLETDGHSVATAADGVEALARLALGRFELLVTDLSPTSPCPAWRGWRSCVGRGSSIRTWP